MGNHQPQQNHEQPSVAEDESLQNNDVKEDDEDMEINTNNNMIDIPINVECKRNPDYGGYFVLSAPYDHHHNYPINKLITNIIEYKQRQHDPLLVMLLKIKKRSFMDHELNCNYFDWKNLDANITDYAKQDVIERGLWISVDIKPYEHTTSTIRTMCKDMKQIHDLCPIYGKMRYQDIFSEQYLNHLYEYDHFRNEVIDKPECKYNKNCYAYKRLEEGGNVLSDRCHIQIYRHPPRRIRTKSSSDMSSYSFNEDWSANMALYQPTDRDHNQYHHNKEEMYLKSLIMETINNGFKGDLCLEYGDEENDNYTIMNIVNEKIRCRRHKLMGMPLNKAEMLAFLLYTGGKANYDLCKTQRNGDFTKWRWFDLCLFNGINKLSKREHGRYKIYTGLCDTTLHQKYVESGYFKTYVSTAWFKEIAMTFVQGQGMIFVIDENFRENAVCCDVSWISKFGDNECEILIARSIDAALNNFECEIADELNGIQTVYLQDFGYRKSKIATETFQQQMIAEIPQLPQLPIYDNAQNAAKIIEREDEQKTKALFPPQFGLLDGTKNILIHGYCHNSVVYRVSDIMKIIIVYCGFYDKWCTKRTRSDIEISLNKVKVKDNYGDIKQYTFGTKIFEINDESNFVNRWKFILISPGKRKRTTRARHICCGIGICSVTDAEENESHVYQQQLYDLKNDNMQIMIGFECVIHCENRYQPHCYYKYGTRHLGHCINDKDTFGSVKQKRFVNHDIVTLEIDCKRKILNISVQNKYQTEINEQYTKSIGDINGKYRLAVWLKTSRHQIIMIESVVNGS